MKRVESVLLLSLLISLVWLGSVADAATNDQIRTHYLHARVTKVISETITNQATNPPLGNQVFSVMVTDAPFSGRVYTIENNSVGDPSFSYWVAKDDQVIVALQETQHGEFISCNVDDYARDNYMAYLILLFVFALVIVGRKQGVKSVISLSVTLLIIAAFLVPRLLQGANPVTLAVSSSVMITVITVLLVGGISVKSVSAVLGTAIGLSTAAAISTYFGQLTRLRGMREEDIQLLLTVPQGLHLDLNGILFAGIIVGAVGAIMDVSMSIASSMDEVNRAGSMNTTQLIGAGMNVGRDVMGTMSNTLILAYVGTSLPLLLYYAISSPPLVQLINSNYLVSELIRSLSGSMGLILAIPITACISGLLLKLKSTGPNRHYSHRNPRR